MSRQRSISVVVCTRNRGDKAARTLESLLNDSCAAFEVILIDQSTNNDTRDSVAKFFDDTRFHYIASCEVGTGRARNMGLAEASGEYVLYTDDDCTVAPNWVEAMASCFDQNERVGVVFCNVLPAPFDSQKGFIPTYVRTTDAMVTSLRQKCRARGIGAGMGVRRRAALDVGGFDSQLGPGTNFPDCEDGDMAVRALLNGWSVYETAKTHVLHDGFRSWQEGKDLTRRNWIGIGAAYAKPIRCQKWRFFVVVAYEGLVVALMKPIREMLQLRKPRGTRSFWYFCKGFWAGWHSPIDRFNIRYLESPSRPTHDHRTTIGRPTVSVGLPVFNGEAYVAEAIQDVLAQTWVDFELIISDNGSTDRTEEICAYFAAIDERVRYVRQSANMGAGWNFNEVTRLSRGAYFKWLAHDDRMAPDFLELCVQALASDPRAVLAYPATVIVSESGEVIDNYSVKLRTDSMSLPVRYSDLVLAWSLCFEVFGLMRSSALQQTDRMGNFGHGDGVFLAQLGMLGVFRAIDAPLHISRRHPNQSMRMFGLSEDGGNDYHRYSEWFNPNRRARWTFPTWRIGWEFYSSIWKFQSSFSDRLRCHATMGHWFRRNAKYLMNDLVVSAKAFKQG